MFLVPHERHGVTNCVFTFVDPRRDGYIGPVEEGVSLDYDMEAVHHWPEGSPRPEVCLGRDIVNPKLYKVFRYRSEVKPEGFEIIAGTPVVFGSWADYARLPLIPPDPDQTASEPWFTYLDRLDEDARRRSRGEPDPDPPTDASRDEVAAWVARSHLLADSAIQEIWYLPQGASADEIRLLERSDRLAGADDAPAQALDFGLDVNGVPFRLFVADVSTEQLTRIERGVTSLPAGWSLDNKKTWRRGA